jgi:crotonobetainyl-CoA:carnitine CoA-transferase CaiB-like acyl-CoA transferase
VFATADRPLAIAAANDKLFALLADALGRPELAVDPRFATNGARVGHRELLGAELEDRLRTATADEWFERLTAVGVPCGPINDLGQAVALAERLGLDPVTEIDDPAWGGTARQVSHPIRLSRTPATYRSGPPTFGAR